MWIEPSGISDVQLRYLDALGRATVLAQNFEQNCKFVFGTHDLGRAYRDGRLSIDEWQVLGRKLFERSLGGVLKAQRGDSGLSADKIAKLEAAREARNYLAHQAAAPGQYVPSASGTPGGSEKILQILKGTLDRAAIERERAEMLEAQMGEAVTRFEGAVRALAEADSLVAGWSYIIQEKDTSLPQFASNYTREIFDWVLEPLREAGC